MTRRKVKGADVDDTRAGDWFRVRVMPPRMRLAGLLNVIFDFAKHSFSENCTMASSQSALRPTQPHIHVAGLQCPVCDQPIPNEKVDQVRERVEARERALSDSVSARLKEQFAQERAQIEASARLSMERTQRESAAAIETVKLESGEREAVAREEASKTAQAAAQQKIDALTQTNANLQKAASEKIEALKQAHTEMLAAAQGKVAQAERARVELEAAASDRVAAAEKAKQAAELEAKTVRENHEATMNERLQEQREALEKATEAAVRAEQAKTFDDRQKLQGTVQQLQRQLEKERADVVGEGAELELFEELKTAFEGDRIRRVPKGTPGADVIHEIIENGKVCGKIVYDSKKRNSWKSEYATKLCADKIAEGAQHAILSLLKFPTDAKQLDLRDGVILANPARVTAVALLLRDHIVQTHGLRLSNQEREKKKGELYAYITSERFEQHLDSIESQTDKLLEIEVAEQKAHRAMWERRGSVVKTLQKAHGNLRADVGRIIGTSGSAEEDHEYR
jgi:hypothetical protein